MRTKTPSFILELPLKTTQVQESTILVRLEAGRQLYNACLGESLKRLDAATVRQSWIREHIKIDENNKVIAYGLEHEVKYCRGDNKAELKQFCSELVPEQKRKLQRKMDI